MKAALILCVGVLVTSCSLQPGPSGLVDERGGSAGSADQDASQFDAPDDRAPDVVLSHDEPAIVPDGSLQTLGEAVPDLLMIQLDINCHDGFFGDFSRTLFVVDVVARTVYRDGQKVTATQAQIDQIVAVISATHFHNIPPCVSMNIDGSYYPPELALGNAWTERKFGVSNLECAKSDHDAYGDVMLHADYQVIRNVIASSFEPVPAPDCT